MFQKEKEVAQKKYLKRGPILMITGIAILVGVISNEVRNYYNEKALLSTVEQLLLEDHTNPVRDGSEGRLPLAETSQPGSGNCVIAGHRNYSFGRFFNRLDEVQIEDEIEIETTEGKTYTYRVREISVVEPDEVSVLEPGRDNILTLITCTPIYIASHRLVVEAKLVE